MVLGDFREFKNMLILMTRTRKAVLEFLAYSPKPVDVVEIATQLAKKRIEVDEVTIYRMLDAFLKKGLVTRLDFHEGKFRYELVQSDHHHVICESCGIVEDVTDCSIESMEKTIVQKQKFLIKRHALEFFGLCNSCK